MPAATTGSAARTVAGVAAIAVLVGGCGQFGATGLDLVVDDSIEITTPRDRATVGRPLEIAWTDADAEPGDSYAVLIDRSPMPPGEPVEWFARDDETCAVSRGCPDALWLARRGITVTDATSAVIEIVPAPDEDTAGSVLTVVRLGPTVAATARGAASVTVDLEEP